MGRGNQHSCIPINRGPLVPLGFKISEEEWTGKKVDLSYLKVFGCASYVYVDLDAIDKLDAKARKCYLIGYGSDYIGYRFWDDQNRKIIRHKDITFDKPSCIKTGTSSVGLCFRKSSVVSQGF